MVHRPASWTSATPAARSCAAAMRLEVERAPAASPKRRAQLVADLVAAGPAPGPIAARDPRGAEPAQRATPSATIPPASPRQPAWTSPTASGADQRDRQAVGGRPPARARPAVGRDLRVGVSGGVVARRDERCRAPGEPARSGRRARQRPRARSRFAATARRVVLGPGRGSATRTGPSDTPPAARGEQRGAAGQVDGRCSPAQARHARSRDQQLDARQGSRWAYSKCARPSECSVSRSLQPKRPARCIPHVDVHRRDLAVVAVGRRRRRGRGR